MPDEGINAWMSATQRGGGPPRGALVGCSEGAEGQVAQHPNCLFVTWIMKKIAVFSLFPKNQGDSEKIGDFLHYFSCCSPRCSPRL